MRDTQTITVAKARVTQALGDVLNERNRQDEKWGRQRHLLGDWFLIIGEELGEAQEAALHLRFPPPGTETEFDGRLDSDLIRKADLMKLRKELVQVAASALAAVEAMDDDPAPWLYVAPSSNKARRNP
jgi:hypothetical protein